MAEISTRPKSPTRAEAISIALRPGPVYCTKVLLGNWVEDRIECPKDGTFYFPPKEEIDYKKMKPELRQLDFKQNKLYGLQGNVSAVIKHDTHRGCENYTTTNDLVYNHLPKPLCGPVLRYYKRSAHNFYPQPDLMKCYGNATEWGLRRQMQYDWNCAMIYDYAATLYTETFVPPKKDDYLNVCNRRAKSSSFTKTFNFKMTKPIARKKK